MKPTFIQPCFIRKNTPELRRKLEELGYEHAQWGWPQERIDKCRILYTEPWCGVDAYWHSYIEWQNKNFINTYLDCGTNEDLFLAIAALMEDSDYMQWFVTDEEHHWVNQGMYMPNGSFIQSFVKDFPKDKVHKATVEELIEHFKNK